MLPAPAEARSRVCVPHGGQGGAYLLSEPVTVPGNYGNFRIQVGRNIYFILPYSRAELSGDPTVGVPRCTLLLDYPPPRLLLWLGSEFVHHLLTIELRLEHCLVCLFVVFHVPNLSARHATCKQ